MRYKKKKTVAIQSILIKLMFFFLASRCHGIYQSPDGAPGDEEDVQSTGETSSGPENSADKHEKTATPIAPSESARLQVYKQF